MPEHSKTSTAGAMVGLKEDPKGSDRPSGPTSERARSLSALAHPVPPDVDRVRVPSSEIDLAHALLERRNHELEQFAIVAAHELKTPLRGIAALSQSHEEGDARGAVLSRREQLALLRERLLRMEALIDGILGYARAGQSPALTTEVDLALLLSDILGLLGAPPGVVTFATPMPCLVAARVPLQQVFMNLIDNALTHGRREGARITIAAEDLGAEWELAVADNGPGIAPRHHERIFQMFVTLSADPTIGTGIGLAVVKKIVDGAGGRVWVESRPGNGATFRFRWPHRERPSR